MTHKIPGILSLLNFAMSIKNFMYSVDNRLLINSSHHMFYYILLVHSVLHLSSFQFVLSDRRNSRYNIIWPEMRLHSMIFAYRSLVTMIVMQNYKRPYSDILRYVIVMFTMFFADRVTIAYKKRNESRTMRDNPYPDGTSPFFIHFMNNFYSISQVFATMHVLFAPHIDYVYMTLIPIQVAPFLMTLQRKGIIDQSWWHILYTLTIVVNYVYSAVHIYNPVKIYAFVIYFVYMRFVRNYNKYLLWTCVFMSFNSFKRGSFLSVDSME